MATKIFIADDSEAGTRLDVYLSGLFEVYSRTKIQELIKSNKVLVNKKNCKPSFSLNPDDEILCDFTDIDAKLEAENIDLDIVYEADEFAIINKPSGMLTHPTSKEKTGTLVNALLYKYGNHLSDLNGEYRRGIVHRLDRNTSGLIIVTKTNAAHEKIAEMIKNRLIEKHYRTIVRGRMEADTIIDTPIGRSKSNPSKMSIVPNGKPSLTEVKIIKQFDNATYLDVNLKTGRTHQIRVHLSSIGHPVFNDTLYGFGKMKIRTDEQVLQSYKLKFINPFSDELIDVEIAPDTKILKILDYLKQRGEE